MSHSYEKNKMEGGPATTFVCFLCCRHGLAQDMIDYEGFILCVMCVHKMDVMSDHFDRLERKKQKKNLAPQ